MIGHQLIEQTSLSMDNEHAAGEIYSKVIKPERHV